MKLFCGFGFVLFLTTYVGSCQMKARLHESTKSFSKKKKKKKMEFSAWQYRSWKIHNLD